MNSITSFNVIFMLFVSILLYYLPIQKVMLSCNYLYINGIGENWVIKVTK